jgi:ABC-type transport system substrate-binding protein
VDLADISTDQGLQLRDQWTEGRVAFNLSSSNWVVMYPQFIDPHPAILSEVRFRRALLHAMDREEIAFGLTGGTSPVAHSFLSPDQPQYREIEAALPRYDFDPRTAAELIEECGYVKNPNGRYQNSAGQPLQMEVRTAPAEGAVKSASAAADYWQRLGITVSTTLVSAQRLQDLEYVATFPSVFFRANANDLAGLRLLRSAVTPLPSNNFRGSGNQSRYMSAEFDSLLGTYFTTLPIPERTRVLGSVLSHIADQVTVAGMFYNPGPAAISQRIVNVSERWPGPYITWNAREWDVKP